MYVRKRQQHACLIVYCVILARTVNIFLLCSSATPARTQTTVRKDFFLLHLNMRVDQVCEFGAASCSVIACTWLLIQLHRVPANVRDRFFPLQIRCLALADLIFVVSCVPGTLVGGLKLHTETLARMCKYQKIPFNFSRHVSLWIEMHLAASAVLQVFKVQAVKPLRCALYLIWLPGLLLTMCSAFTEPWTYDLKERVCVPTNFLGTADPLDTADFALCMCICAGSYVAIVYVRRLQHSPSSVQGRASRKVAAYLVNAVLTYGLLLACYVDGTLFRNKTVYTIAYIFQLLGGCFNTFTYAMQSRYAAALRGRSTVVRDSPTALQRSSFDVAFAEDIEVVADIDVDNSRFLFVRQSRSFEVQHPPSTDTEVDNSRFLFVRQS